MDRFLGLDCNEKLLSPLTLAFLGDAVFEIMVREELVCEANRPVRKLHNLAVERVKAASQAEGAKKIMHVLTEEETTVLKRGRNATTNHTPKNALEGDYHYATGLEALFGYLYLQSKFDRLRELFNLICE